MLSLVRPLVLVLGKRNDPYGALVGRSHEPIRVNPVQNAPISNAVSGANAAVLTISRSQRADAGERWTIKPVRISDHAALLQADVDYPLRINGQQACRLLP
jgi:hypothetical protein